MVERRLVVSQLLIRRILEHCLDEKPNEACGILSGRGERVMTAWATQNARQSPTAYEVEVSHQERALVGIRRRKEELLAIYHSHPTAPAYPSGNDIRMAVHWPEALRVIVSLSGNRSVAKAFRIVGNAVEEIPIVTTATPYGDWQDLRQRC
jgi:proteasome lid subunit RPN8/RPN11